MDAIHCLFFSVLDPRRRSKTLAIRRGLCVGWGLDAAIVLLCSLVQKAVFYLIHFDEKEKIDAFLISRKYCSRPLNQNWHKFERFKVPRGPPAPSCDYRRYAETLFDILVAGGTGAVPLPTKRSCEALLKYFEPRWADLKSSSDFASQPGSPLEARQELQKELAEQDVPRRDLKDDHWLYVREEMKKTSISEQTNEFASRVDQVS
ncbi:hypothetical protein cypCar_00047841 [Cyprinus carpio]|nr:hypothetical protein cypCar_00047841 [Cyprinus carpio]